MSEHPISVEDARQWLGIRQTDGREDESLALLIPAVCDAVEAYLPYCIVSDERRAWFRPGEPIRVKPWARAASAWATGGFGTVDVPVRVVGGSLVVPVDGVPERADGIEVEWEVEGRCPPVVRQALLTALKTAYEQRSGPMVTEEVLEILRPETEVSVR